MWNSLIGQVYMSVLYAYVWWSVKVDVAMDDMSDWIKLRK